MQSLEDLTKSQAICRGCGDFIYDRYFLMVSHDCWHMRCLRCSDCNVELESDITCFVKDDMIFCRADYFKRYGSRSCAACSQAIDSAAMVMRAREFVFHLQCFACVECNRVLVTGESFGMNGDKVYCHKDFQTFLLHEQDRSDDDGGQNKSRKRKREMNNCAVFEQDNCSPPFIMEEQTGCNGKAKRVRTSFKQHQLLVMKTYFALNHNPDSKDLKQLSIKTGLSKRVLQVWFQNARAKYRRVVSQTELIESHLHCEMQEI